MGREGSWEGKGRIAEEKGERIGESRI